MSIDIATGDLITPREIEYDYKMIFEDRNLKIIKETIDLAVGDDYIIFSSETKKGRDKVLDIINSFIVKNEIDEIEEI